MMEGMLALPGRACSAAHQDIELGSSTINLVHFYRWRPRVATSKRGGSVGFSGWHNEMHAGVCTSGNLDLARADGSRLLLLSSGVTYRCAASDAQGGPWHKCAQQVSGQWTKYESGGLTTVDMALPISTPATSEVCETPTLTLRTRLRGGGPLVQVRTAAAHTVGSGSTSK